MFEPRGGGGGARQGVGGAGGGGLGWFGGWTGRGHEPPTQHPKVNSLVERVFGS